ncbi:MAG: protein kinase [Candidatus Obscuribacterales bacterium]|nr:protein kinase [Candidatus Obscuribacterales bacterium]
MDRENSPIPVRPANFVEETSSSIELREAVATAESIEASGTSLVGQRISTYEIQSFIGEGGSSTVYQGINLTLGNQVAIKILHEDLVCEEAALARFKREALALSSLSHPAIAALKEFGAYNRRFYIVTEYSNGVSLADIIEKEKKLSPDRALSILIQAVEALTYAHKKNVVHRDIKPANIIVSTDSKLGELVKIIDFGIAGFADSDQNRLTQTGELLGTVLYMSPEQCRGATVDGRSDIFSLGCLAYEMLTGTPAFPSASALEGIMQRVSDDKFEFKKKISAAGFKTVIQGMLAKDPQHRYQSGEELLADLVRLKLKKRPIGKPVPSKYRFKRVLQIALILFFSVTTFLICLYNFCFPVRSMADLTKLIASEPTVSSHYFERAKLYEREDNLTAAIADLDKAIRLDPTSYYAYKHRSEDYTNLNKPDMALIDAERAMKLKPDDYKSYILRAEALLGLKKYPEAINDLAKSLSLERASHLKHGDQTLIYLHLAECYINTNEYQLALDNIELSIKTAPTQHQAFHNNSWTYTMPIYQRYIRGKANLGLGRIEEAQRDAKECALLEPSGYYSQKLLTAIQESKTK